MLSQTIAEFLFYAKTHLSLSPLDAIYCQNLLLKRFGLQQPYEGEVDEKAIASETLPDRYVEAFSQYFMEKEGMDANEAERECVWLFGLVSPRPSEVSREFEKNRAVSPDLALDELYRLSIANYYVQKSKIDKNIVFNASFSDGPDLEISINLSKPEKNNKDIAKLVHAKASGYPACALCKENLGFEGDARRPARENIRIVPLKLDEEDWYLQYSPYGYYYEHCILLFDHHVPMEMNRRILSKLLSFLDQFPGFFIGSNSDLPIVGGSILNHEHFQGGRHEMPLFKAKALREIPCPHFPHCKLEEIDFYNTVLRITSASHDELLDLAETIMTAWRHYDDPACSILSSDEAGQHSTVTPLAKKVDGVYQMYLILRNNRCDETYPDGIFHAHPEYAHIKHEGIGLIEAAGLFILPARLVRQSKEAEEASAKHWSMEEAVSHYPDLDIFSDMIEKLNQGMTTKQYLASVCRGILNNVAVFKKGEEGKAGLNRFLGKVNL